ncbi:MAG: thioredoxin fold domain-containing protein [Candidatus Kapaibacterium sp.]
MGIKLPVFFLALVMLSISASAEVHFRNVSFEEAKQLAAQEHKAIMVDFYTTWCGWCKVLDKNTYSDENVGKVADAKFIPVKIDAEKGEGIELAKKYGIHGYPTIIFFDEGGKEIDRVVGYEDPSRFLQSLQNAAAGGSSAIIGEVESAKSTTDPKKWFTAANYYAEHNERAKSVTAFKKVLALDPQNKLGNNAESLFAVGFLSTGDKQFNILDSALRVFPNEVDADQANMLLIRHDFDAKEPENAARRIDRWAMTHPKDGPSFNFFAWTAAQHGAMLDRAMEYSKRAESLASTPEEKASSIDTRAEILFKEGKAAEASQTEASAIAMIDPIKDKKLLDELNGQKALFDKGAPSTTTGTASANH